MGAVACIQKHLSHKTGAQLLQLECTRLGVIQGVKRTLCVKQLCAVQTKREPGETAPGMAMRWFDRSCPVCIARSALRSSSNPAKVPRSVCSTCNATLLLFPGQQIVHKM